MTKLSKLVLALNDALPKFKSSAFSMLAEPLRAAIWNWIYNFPYELVNFVKEKNMEKNIFKEAPLNLFEAFMNYSAKKGKENIIWPVMTMLLLLSPENLSTAIMGYKQNSKGDTKKKERKFITQIVDALKNPKDKLNDASAICFVDIFRVSSYISKTDFKALRFLSAESQSSIQDKLILSEDNVKKDTKVDIKLTVDFIVGSFKVNPGNATSYQFPLLFKGSISYKLVVTKVLLHLAKENPSLYWDPNLSKFKQIVPSYIRQLLQTVINLVNSEVKPTTNPTDKKDTKKQPIIQEIPQSLECLLNLLTLCYTDPKLLLYPDPQQLTTPSDEHRKNILYAFGVLCKCLEEKQPPRVQNQAYKLLLKLFNMKYISLWSTDDIITGFLEISSSVLSSFASQLLEYKDLQGRLIKTILDLMKELTGAANRFIEKNKDKITKDHINNRKRISAFKTLEKTLLILLCSPDTEVWQTAASCFADICDQIDILGENGDKKNSIALNYALYRKLSSVEELGKTPESQQQGIRAILRSTSKTNANMATFLDVKMKWKDIKKDLIGNVKDPNEPDRLDRQRIIWKNYTEFLISLGGVCMKVSEESISDEKGSSVIKSSEKDKKLAEELIREIIEIMISSSKNNNHVAAMKNDLITIIGNELHLALYGLLFEHFHKQVSTFFNEDGSLQTSLESTQFVEKAILISRILVDNTEKGAQDMENSDFEMLITSFIKYVNHLANDKNTEAIKSSICSLIKSLTDKGDIFKFKNDIPFRTQTMYQISEWTSDFVHKLSEQKEDAQVSREKDYPLDISCITAISCLLKDLPFKEYKDFLKLFGFFIRYLHTSAHDNSPNAVKLRQITVFALGNLLEANFNFGLDQFLKYIYIERKETVRTSFLDVLTNITKKGLNLQDEKKEKKDVFSNLYDLLVQDNMNFIILLFSVVPIQDQDNLCNSLVRIFELKNKAIDLLKLIIDLEVNSTMDKSVLFRANSSASKLITAFIKYSSKNYLMNSLGSLVSRICTNATHFEVDEGKIKEGENLEENISNLDSTCRTFLDCIQLYLEDVPYKVRMIINYLWKKVDEKFPSNEIDQHNARHLAVGGIFFLRFVCPAIVSPQSNGIIDFKPDEQASRFLMLITKTLQNVANGVTFGQKEKAMNPLNKFINEKLPEIRNFLDEVATLPENGDETIIVINCSQDEKKLDWESVYRYLFKSFDDVKKKIDETKSGSHYLSQLDSIINELGKPSEEVKEQQSYISKDFKSAELTKFMQPFENQDMTEFTSKQFCYTSGFSVEKRPVFYFILRQFYEPRRINKDEISDGVVYLILKTLQSIFTKPYDVVIDCTAWNFPIKDNYLMKILTLLPVGARKNAQKIIFYNPNSLTLRQFSKINKFTLLSKKLFKKFIFVTGTKELYQHIDEKNNYLPETSMKYDTDVQDTFGKSSLIIKGDLQERKLTNIKLNNQYMYSLSEDKILNLNVKLIDFFPLTALDRVTLDNEQTVSFNFLLSLSTEKRYSFKIENGQALYDSILKAIQRLKSDLALSSSLSEGSNGTPSLKQSDVPGAMLNMCFLSLESNNPKTRSASYNLLVALAEQFSFPVTVMENRELSVPHNTSDLVVILSTQVAKAKPGLTLSFLKAALKGYNLYTKSFGSKQMINKSLLKMDIDEDEGLAVPYKYLALKFIKPWIQNVAPYYEENMENAEEVEKVKEWFVELTTTTISDKDIYPALLNEVWSEIAKEPSLVKIAMDAILKEGIARGIVKGDSEVLGDLVVTLASSLQSAKIVVNIILEEIIKALEESKTENEEQTWDKITVLCRYLLMLSFQNRINVNDNLPTLFYIISLTCGKSSLYLRNTIHGLTINLTHSLCTSHKVSNEIKKQIQTILHELTQPEIKGLFFDPSFLNVESNSNIFDKKTKIPEIDMWKHEEIVLFLTRIINTCFKLEPNNKKRMFGEWNKLVRTSISKMNFEILPRLLIVFGILENSIMVKESTPFILNVLRNAITSGQKREIPISVLLCLSQFCFKISPDDPILPQYCFIALTILGGADEKLFNSAVQLFKSAISVLSNGKLFNSCSSFEEYFKKYIRTEENDQHFIELEKVTQITFSTHFTFALSAFFMRGLTSQSQTRDKTCELFVTILEISKKLNPKIPDLLGYITALIPFNYEKIHQVLGENMIFYSEDNFSHKLSPVLFTRFLMSIVQSVSEILNPGPDDNFEVKKVIIFKVLQEVFEKIPNPFYPIFSEVLQRTITYYKTSCSSQQKKLSEVTLQLINTIMLHPDAALKESPSNLKEISFTGIDRLRSFFANANLGKTIYSNVLFGYLKGIIGDGKVDVLPNEKEEIFILTQQNEMKEEKIDL